MRPMAPQWEAIKYINILVVLFFFPPHFSSFCCCVRMMQKFTTLVINYWPFFFFSPPPFLLHFIFYPCEEYITSVMCRIYTRSADNNPFHAGSCLTRTFDENSRHKCGGKLTHTQLGKK